MLSELISHPVLLVTIISVVFSLIFFTRRRNPYLPGIPIIGAYEGDWFPLLQAKWRNTKNPKAAMDLAYSQYRNRAVMIPVASAGDIVMLPSSEIDFVADQPVTNLGSNERTFEMYQIDYTFMDPTVPKTTLHGSLLQTALTPQLGSMIPLLADEVEWVFDKYWGTSIVQWREVCVYETMRHIIGGVANRAFVGLPFCRDPELVNNGMAFAADLPLSGAILNLFWKPLLPLIAPFVTIPNRIHTRRFRKILTSEIERRLRDYDARQANPLDKSLEPEANDLLQWSIQQAKADGDPSMWRSQTLADRMLIVNFAAIHTTSFTSTCAVFDIISSTPDVVDELREEIKSVLAANGGQWTKRTLAQLKKLDSALRESSRLSSILTTGLGRVVVAEKGLTTPSGAHLPKGTHVHVPAYSVMRDEEIYPDAEAFKPFRFSDEQNGDGSVKRGPNTLPTTNPDFLVFGHGKHACPGRFFAAAELKLVLAYALLHYDFQADPVKPQGPWYGITRLPPMKATIKVKKREEV